MSIPRALQDRLRDGHVIPFVGAGVSMSILDRRSHQPVFPSWRQLLDAAGERLAQELKQNDADLVRSFLNVKPAQFLQAANWAQKSLGPVWYEFLKDKIDIPFDRIEPASLELARRIWRLGSNLVITTNYDEVLKWACPRQDDLQSWDIEAPVELAGLLRHKLHRPTVWHLHGHISNAAQVILSPDGYELLYPDANGDKQKVEYQAALEALRYQLASKSFLFVGFSLDDEYFGTQLASLHEIYKSSVGPHYAVVREEYADRARQLNIEPVTVSDYQESLFALMAELEAAVESRGEFFSRPAIIPDYGPHHSVFYVPFKQKGDEIVGQQQVLEDVRKQLTEGKPTAIGQTAAFRGLGGLGKTQLAIEYAYRYRNEYPNGVIWLTADQNIDAQLIEIAEKARWIASESEHKYKIQIAQQRIRSYSDCLIVFDNLEDRQAIDPYLPEPEANPHILVTSRIDHADFYPLALELLDEQLSYQLLVQEARRDPENEEQEKAAKGIVSLLGGLPLALELAGAYLAHRRTVTFQQYYELLSKDLKTALPKNVSSFTKHEPDLYTTLRLSEALLDEQDGLREILDLLTWSGSAPMSTGLISHLLAFPNDAALANALALGAELRLLQQSNDRDSYSLHRLVGEVRRTEIPLEHRLEWVDSVCRRAGDWFQEKREDFSELSRFESEIDHLKKWQENAARFGPSHSSRLMWLQAYPAYHRGRYVDARNYVIEAQRILGQRPEPNLELKANLLNDYAYTSWQLGDTRIVQLYYDEALQIRQNLFGERHPEIASSLNALGGWYRDQGNLQLALEYAERALAMRRELFGDHHPDIATSLGTVGGLYGDQGNIGRALELSEQALGMRRHLFGDRHPYVASSLESVGLWYGEQGNLERALRCVEDALTMKLEFFGEVHPHIADSLNGLGNCYGKQGDLQRAFEYCEKALAMRQELFGDRHPDIANSFNNIGHWYGEQGNRSRALEYLESALKMRRQLFGQQHPAIAISLNNVAAEYGEQGDVSRALQYSEEALTMQRALYGAQHPLIATSINNIAGWLGGQGKVSRALEFAFEGLAMRKRLFGESHPDIAYSLNTVGRLYAQDGDLKLSLDYFEQALAMRRALFGTRHPDIADSLHNLAAVHHKQGNAKSAIKYSEPALAMYQALFGDRHFSTVGEAIRVAVHLAESNRRGEAYDLVNDFLPLAQGSQKEELKRLETQLLSKLIRPGFRQPPKPGKRKGKKKRR